MYRLYSPVRLRRPTPTTVTAKRAARARWFRPALERLEDRWVPSALAVKIESGALTVIVNDGGPGDLDGLANNQILVQSGIGTPVIPGFNIQVESALTNSPGSATGALLQTSYTLRAQPAGGGTVTVTTSATGFTQPPIAANPLTLVSQLDGNGSGSGTMTAQAWADPSDTQFGMGANTPGPQGPFNLGTSGGYSSTATTTFNRGAGSFALTSQFIAAVGAGSNTTGSLQLTVPAPPVQPEARISITPDATNEVGQPHTFTVLVEQDDGLSAGAPGGDAFNGFGPAAGANTTVNLTNQNGASTSPLTFTGTTNASGQFQVTFTSPTAGQVVGNATATLVVSGQTLTRDTDPATAIVAGPGGSGPAVKTFEDARITITPNDVNEVGQPHTFTVTVSQDDGLAAGAPGGDAVTGFGPAAGKTVVVTLTNSNGAAATPAGPFTLTTDAAGQVQVTFTSATAGVVTGNASTTFVLNGVTLTRDTDPATATVGAGPGGSGPAVKAFEDARITITPNDVNEVGQPHTFTVTVSQDDGLAAGAPGGDAVTGFGPAAGKTVVVTLTNSNGAVASPAGPFTLTTNASGQVQVTFTSATAGVVTGNASTSFVLNGVTLTRDTDPATATVGAGPGGSGPAVKAFEDARITITPNDVNEVGQPHTFTVTVSQDDGLVAGAPGGDAVTGFGPAAGKTVVVTLTNSNGAAATPAGPFTLTTDAAGQVQVTFTSATAGVVTGNASTTFVLNGVTLTRDTDPSTATVGAGPGGSGPAVKAFEDARITITPNDVNEVGQPHTFTVTVSQDDGLAAGAPGGDAVTGFGPAAGKTVVVTLTNSNGAVASPAGPFTLTTNASGQVQVTFTSATAGVVTGNASTTFVLNGVTLTRDTDPSTATVGAGPGGSGPAVKAFEDARITITPNDVNEVGQPHTFTVTVSQDDGLAAGAPGGDAVTGFGPAVGKSVVVTLTNSNGAVASPAGPFTLTTDAAGQVQVTFTSATAGVVTGNASTTFVLNGVTLTRDTDPATATIGAGPGGSGPAVKAFENARITITPDATNEVGKPHTFTVTVAQDDGLAAGAPGGDGVSGFGPAAGKTVVVTLTNSNGAAATPAGPFTLTTNALGQVQVTFASATAGVVTGNASTSFVLNGVTLTRDTDPATATIGSGPGGSGPAVKRFVDARIVLTPATATNLVNQPHTVTATVSQNDGLPAGAPGGDAVTGFGPALNGTLVTFSLVNNSAGAVFVSGNTATVTGGVCTIQINSANPGGVDIHGVTSFLVGGVLLTRASGDGISGDSSDAHKDYVPLGRLSGDKLQAVPTPGESCRMTGGGSVFTVGGDLAIDSNGSIMPAGSRITHGFEIHCDPLNVPNRIEINWGGGQNFHLDNLDQIICLDDPAISPLPPQAMCDTFIGVGHGKFNGVAGATLWFTFTDAGEPGNLDTAGYLVKDAGGNTVLSVGQQPAAVAHAATPPLIQFGNQQAHKEHAASFGGGTTFQPWTIGGVNILLLNATQTTLVASTPLNSAGHFQFSNLLPGTYVVAEEFPAGYQQVSPSSGTAITWTTKVGPATDIIGPFGFTVTVTAGSNTVISTPFVNGAPTTADCRWTGGGSIFTNANDFALSTTGTALPANTRITHGFELHCDLSPPNNLEINWGGGQNFHLTSLTNAVCLDDPAIAPKPPNADCDTIIAAGVGRFNNVDGYQIQFTFTDAGEPGKLDTAKYLIWLDQPGTVANPGTAGIYEAGIDKLILNVGAKQLQFGNHQAHKDSGGGGSAVAVGQFAAISFWSNANGQGTIQSFNGSSTSTSLGKWLATNFPNLFGNTAGPVGNLSGKTNSQVASLFKNLNTNGQANNTFAQAMAVALGIYADTTSLGGASIVANGKAKKYGFLVTAAGGADSTITSSTDAPAFGTYSGSLVSAWQSLKVVDGYYNPQARALFGGDSFGISLANDLLTRINQGGKITLVSPDSPGATDAPLITPLEPLTTGKLVVAVDTLPPGNVAAEKARIDDAIARLNAWLGKEGVSLSQISGDANVPADFHMRFAATSVIGGMAEGILGVTESGDRITVITGWNYYFGSGTSAIGANQYDFETVIFHELGHALGLGHSKDTGSAMYKYLGTAQTRRNLTVADMALIDDAEDGYAALLAAPIEVQAGAISASAAAAFSPNVLGLAGISGAAGSSGVDLRTAAGVAAAFSSSDQRWFGEDGAAMGTGGTGNRFASLWDGNYSPVRFDEAIGMPVVEAWRSDRYSIKGPESDSDEWLPPASGKSESGESDVASDVEAVVHVVNETC